MMEPIQTDKLTQFVEESKKKREELLPWWLTPFMWICIALIALSTLRTSIGVGGFYFGLNLYGLSTDYALSMIGIVIIALFLLKAITLYGFVKQKYWAVQSGITDAIAGILVCLYTAILPLIIPGADVGFRLEFIVLIPYLITMLKIQTEWKNAAAG